jgi:hypothetical protein
MEPSMWHVSAIPWKAAYGPQEKKACALNETTMGGNLSEARGKLTHKNSGVINNYVDFK